MYLVTFVFKKKIGGVWYYRLKDLTRKAKVISNRVFIFENYEDARRLADFLKRIGAKVYVFKIIESLDSI